MNSIICSYPHTKHFLHSESGAMDWRAISRSRSRVSMDWRPNSVSRSRSRAPTQKMRLDFDSLEQAEQSHTRALLANLEEDHESPGSGSTAPGGTGTGGLFIHSDGQQREHQEGDDPEAAANSVSAAAAIPAPASTGSAQSLLSLRLQGLTNSRPDTEAEGDKQAGPSSQQNTTPFPPFQPPPNPFQNQYTAMFMPQSLPTFPHLADPFAGEKQGDASTGFAGNRVSSHDQLGASSSDAFIRRPRKTSFDHTVVSRDDGNGGLARFQNNAKPLSPVLSNSSLVCITLNIALVP